MCIAVSGGCLRIEKCVVTSLEGAGILSRGEGSRIDMVESEVYGCGHVGVAVERGGHTSLKRCNVSEARDAGILVRGAHSYVVADQCRITGSMRQGVACESCSRARLSKCLVAGSWMQGVACGSGGEAEVMECEVEGSVLAGIGAYGEGSRLSLVIRSSIASFPMPCSMRFLRFSICVFSP